MKQGYSVGIIVNLLLKNNKENTGRIVVFKEIKIKQSYTLESSYFRALPETSKSVNPKSVPMSTSIRYNSQLINSIIININEDNLLEFGKFFAHTVNHYFNTKKVFSSTKIIEALREDEEE